MISNAASFLASKAILTAANDNLHLRLVCDNTSSDRLLTASQAAPGNYSYIYDRLDNATSVTTPSGSVTPSYNGFNQLKVYGASTYAYDLTGNTLSGDGTRSYKWDAENRLVEIDYSSGAKSNFSYDGMGHRMVDVETAVGGGTTTMRYLWCGSTICQTRNGSDTVLRRDMDEGEYTPAPTSKFLYLPDQLGSTRDVVSATGGALVDSFDYGPYGEITRSYGAAQIDYRYAGLFYHTPSALNLATYRQQDTGTSMGRWINRDPIREAGGVNLYGYVGARPTGYIDISGLINSCTGTPPNNGPNCDEQWQNMINQINLVLSAHKALLLDPYDLFSQAYSVSNPSLPTQTTYVGHMRSFEGYQTGLQRMVNKARDDDCPIPPNAQDIINMDTPISPLPKN